MSEMWRADNVETITGFLTANECDDYIRLGEDMGFEDATMFASRGMKDMRNNERVMLDDPERARILYDRLSGHLALSFQDGWMPIGLSERLRLYRYDVGQFFDWHRDGHFDRGDDERSQFTFMVYLNEDFKGGATSFVGDDILAGQSALVITPQKGMALMFHHPILHRGDRITAGRKYVLRGDVMYHREMAR